MACDIRVVVTKPVFMPAAWAQCRIVEGWVAFTSDSRSRYLELSLYFKEFQTKMFII